MDMADAALQRLVEIEAIRQLKARYCYCVAHEDWTEFERLFAPELQFITPDGALYDGRKVFMAYHVEVLQKPKVWGVVRCFTSQIDITGPDAAHGVWQMEDVHVWPTGGDKRVGHHGYGHYHEDYVRSAEGWRFKVIRVTYERMEPLEGGFSAGMRPETSGL
jgi:uncharacterized protein (TIGR02246 family)